MKKITKLFMTMLTVGVFSFVHAQIDVDGTLTGAPTATPVDVFVDGSLVATLNTNASGYFTGGTYSTSGTQGGVDISFTDCNGTATTINNFYSPASTTVSFGNVDFCPPTSYDASATFNLSNVTSAVSLNISWDNGVSYTSVNTDAIGYSYNVETAIPNANSGTFLYNFVDCNGTTVSGSDTYSVSLPNMTFNDDYCPIIPPACSASFGFTQQTTQTPNGLIPNGPITIVDYSTGSNLTYTWDFGDGSALYTGVNFTHTYPNNGPFEVCLTVDNGSGCTDTYCDSVAVDTTGILEAKTNNSFVLVMGNGSNPTAINELDEEVSFSIFPNPAENSFNIALNSPMNANANLSIFDISGKLIETKLLNTVKGEQVINVDINGFQKGIYIVQLKSNNNTVTKKLTIK